MIDWSGLYLLFAKSLEFNSHGGRAFCNSFGVISVYASSLDSKQIGLLHTKRAELDGCPFDGCLIVMHLSLFPCLIVS